MTEYSNLVRDFRQRTLDNMVIVERNDGYEVTQLVNSLLGLVILPKEKATQLPSTALRELTDFPNLNYSSARGLSGDTALSSFWRFLRNSVAHFNIEFEQVGGEITGLKLSNRHRGQLVQGPLRLDLEQLRALVEFLTKIAVAPGGAIDDE